MNAQGKPLALAPGAGRDRWQLGMLLTFKATGEETAGEYWALEGLAPVGAAPPLHVHALEDETWFVLDGQIEFTVGDEFLTLEPGGFAYVPRGTAHTFRVLSPTARWFGFGNPAGFDRWFFEQSEPATAHELPPPPTGELDIGALLESMREYGTEALAPPA